MIKKNTGSCLCGEVAFEVKGEFESFYLCHCERCRKSTGTAHAANLFSTRAKLNWLAGENKVKSFQVPDTRHAKCFCSDCGSALPSVQMEGKLLVIPAGSLDSDFSIKPNAHIFVSSKAGWDEELENVVKLERLPS
ncbi:GFA family protein [Aliikangiella coralliicola]|uniref:GFA family protein n=1 Tax=Aliikangiella coralliicola TaxID=2592383 RepID=A0A545UFH3_9GAMM|nr:GFA family protein [Aliikangiella coralliicola]TQV88222.1 GFA family protein [Aliikangiella coralliicola]